MIYKKQKLNDNKLKKKKKSTQILLNHLTIPTTLNKVISKFLLAVFLFAPACLNFGGFTAHVVLVMLVLSTHFIDITVQLAFSVCNCSN